MIGWFLSVYQTGLKVETQPKYSLRHERKPVIRWSTGLGGLEWIEGQCKAGTGVFLGGDGYPYKYALVAAAAKPVLLRDPTSLYWKAFVEGELPLSGGEGLRDSARIEGVPDDEWLLFEVFDQS